MTEPARISESFDTWIGTTPPVDGGRAVDAVVIGSGYGAAVAALRLARLGRDVVVFERGSEYAPGHFPADLSELPSHLRAQGPQGQMGSPTGLFEVRAGPGVTALVANGLGGGSLINAGVMMRPDDEVFAQAVWPSRLRTGTPAASPVGTPAARERGSLDWAFLEASRSLGGHQAVTPPGAPGIGDVPKAIAFRSLARDLAQEQGHPFRVPPPELARVTIDPNACTRCGDCATGCNVPGAKLTLRSGYLQQAAHAGATLVTCATVYSVAPSTSNAGPWHLRIVPTERTRDRAKLAEVVEAQGIDVWAQVVVIAAGTFGSTELLMRSRDLVGHQAFSLSPALGARFSGNGDSLSVSTDDPVHVDALGQGRAASVSATPVGPTITSTIDLRGPKPTASPQETAPPPLEHRLVLQEGAVPAALIQLFAEGIAFAGAFDRIGTGRPRVLARERWLDPDGASHELARRTQVLLTMGHDLSPGRLVWVPAMNGVAPFIERPEALATYRRQQRLFDAISATGRRHLHLPLWRSAPAELLQELSGPTPKPMITTVHPLGGCCMADRFEDGVVDEFGRVWRGSEAHWPGLFVLDGSIVPTSLGCNPMWTITALAERAMHHLAADLRPQAGQASTRPPRSFAIPIEPPPRRPLPRPQMDIEISERLLVERLDFGRSLARRLGTALAEAELIVDMQPGDWAPFWASADHRIERLSGRLVFVWPPAGSQGEPHPDPTRFSRIQYRVAKGTVELLPIANGWPLIGPLARAFRLLHVGITWWILRGRRDLGQFDIGARSWAQRVSYVLHLIRLLWAATEVRIVRYDLWAVERVRSGPLPPRPPTGWWSLAIDRLLARTPRELKQRHRVRIRGGKHITYAATTCQIVRYLWQRWTRTVGEQPSPRDLRPAVAELLTQPTLVIDDGQSLGAWLPASWPRWLGGRTRGYFWFDPYWAMRQSPLRLRNSGDLTRGLMAAAAYPALVARWLMRSFFLEFRAPDLSGRVVIDDARPKQVALRTLHGSFVHPACFTLQVPRGDTNSDDGTQIRGDIELRLWRYPRKPEEGAPGQPASVRGAIDEEATWYDIPVRRARTVLLTHAFAMSGYTFTFKGTQRNFAEHLWENGWDVWILDTRMSPRVDGARDPGSLDLVAKFDIPKAVDHILETLDKEHPPSSGPKAKLQIFAFGQCLGAAALQMSLLAGRLSHGDPAGNGRVARLSKIAALVSSQTHLITVGSRSSQGKTWLPYFIRDLARRQQVPLAVRQPVSTLLESITDRFLGALPVPAAERCPHEGRSSRAHEDDCATCRRIRFLDAELFRHANLNERTHAELPLLFGDGAITMWAHGARIVEYERLVTEDGINAYVTDDRIARHMAMPVRFVHGALNELFDREGAERSGRLLAKIHPDWAAAFSAIPGGSQPWDVIDGFGHLDVLIGKQAMGQGPQDGNSVYARLAALLEKAAAKSAHPCGHGTSPARAAIPLVRFPAAGPWMAPPYVDGDELIVGIAFQIDDDWAESGARDVEAGVIVHMARTCRERYDHPVQPECRKLHRLDVRVWRAPRTPDAPEMAAQPPFSHRIAHGVLRLPVPRRGRRVVFECCSWVMVADDRVSGSQLMQGTLPITLNVAQLTSHRSLELDTPGLHDARGTAPNTHATADPEPVSITALDQAIAERRSDILRERLAARRPVPHSLSRRRRAPWPARSRYASLNSWRFQCRGGARVAVGCCRYPGFEFDRARADAAFARLCARALPRPGRTKTEAAAESIDALLMLGDQIYADATAGLADPLSPIERYLMRHEQAFRTPHLRRLLQRLPVVSVPDDHEFNDGWPHRRPLYAGATPADTAAPGGRGIDYVQQREQAATRAARRAAAAFQWSHLPDSLSRRGWCSLALSQRVRLFVLDTRCRRRHGRTALLAPGALAQLRHWIQQSPADAMNVVMTASVILPQLRPHTDPANPGPEDSMAGSPAERDAILAALASQLPGRFVLLSGDYHFCAAGTVDLNAKPVGAWVVAPPFYAPFAYANARPTDIDSSQVISLAGLGSLRARAGPGRSGISGSGYGILECTPTGQGWRIRYMVDVIDHESGHPGETVELLDLHLT